MIIQVLKFRLVSFEWLGVRSKNKFSKLYGLLTTVLLLLFFTSTTLGQQTIRFSSLDKLPVTADLYTVNDTRRYLVLCHLSEHSRGEYRKIAKRFMENGYNCMAIDTRTGNQALGIVNETALEAKKQDKSTDFLSSEQDILAAINYADSLSKGKGVILIGSSFSASLSLKVTTSNNKVIAVAAFSPGEHFGPSLNLANTIRNLVKPTFVTSSLDEHKELALLYEKIPASDKTHFIPINKGMHGAISLWDYNPNHQEYWDALLLFLKKYK